MAVNKKCKFCGTGFRTSNPRKVFCCSAHKYKWYRRYGKRAKVKVKSEGEEKEVDDILKGAKRIAANVPTVGDILREEKPKGDKKVYQPTYEDFFEWCGRTGDYPKKVFDDYVKTSNLGTSSQSLIAGRVLCDTLRQIRAEYFDMVKDFLLTAVGKEKPSRADLYRQRALRMSFNAMLDPEKGGAK